MREGCQEQLTHVANLSSLLIFSEKMGVSLIKKKKSIAKKANNYFTIFIKLQIIFYRLFLMINFLRESIVGIFVH